MVRFTAHAKDSMSKRGLSEEDILQVLAKPRETIPTRANRQASYAQIRGKYIVVIHEKQDSEDLVITAMTVNASRMIRFGFTQIR